MLAREKFQKNRRPVLVWLSTASHTPAMENENKKTNYISTYNRDRNVIDFNDKDYEGNQLNDDELAVNLEAEEKVTPFVVFLTVSDGWAARRISFPHSALLPLVAFYLVSIRGLYRVLWLKWMMRSISL